MLNDNKTSCESQTVLFSVYVIWCRVTGKFYVGVTHRKVETRIRQHKHSGRQFIGREIQRIGWDGNWDRWIVESYVPANLITEREQYWVNFFDCVYLKGYNKTGGGIGTIIVTDDTREIMRQKALARDMSGENNPHYGKSQTAEAREIIRQSRLGKSSWNKGISCSEEAKENLRQKALAKNMNGENNPFYGKKHTEETKALMREKVLARHAAKRAAKAVAEENLAAANSTPTSLSTLLDAVIFQ